MGHLFGYITILTSVMNGIMAIYLSYRLFYTQKKTYLTEQFRNFFIYFAIYFLTISVIVNTTLNNPYLFFVSVEATHFILYLALAFLFSAFLYIRRGIKTRTAFWFFVIIGFTIMLASMTTVNPGVTSLNATDAYLFHYEVLIPKILLLSLGFLYPAVSFLKEAIVSKDKFIKERSYLFSLTFTLWLVGGFLHSQNQNSLIFLAGDLILLVGFFTSAVILLEKNTGAKKAPATF